MKDWIKIFGLLIASVGMLAIITLLFNALWCEIGYKAVCNFLN